MTRCFCIVFTLVLASPILHGQEIQNGSISINGHANTIRFINLNNESYLSWTDLSRLLPMIFTVSQKGEIIVNPLATNPALLNSLNPPNTLAPSTESVIETQIDGDFEGWTGETIFKLMNGQIWQQDEYAYEYDYAFMPDVTIYKTSSGWKMKVEGVSDEIGVKRIK